ncbi:MAG: DUF1289 domain-containing protein [Proteobacteria bacterium]|nr:DUF1289 domain-containing protein [Pseudomonadota bacterium]
MEKSPCVRICTLNDEKICVGCGRNAYELKNWINFSDETKKLVKLGLAKRLADISANLNKRK